MRRFWWLIPLVILSCQVALAQDNPQPLLTIPHEWSIGGARWHPNSHDFWTWNRQFRFQESGDTQWTDHLRFWNGETGSLENEFQYHGDNIMMYTDWSAGEHRMLVYGGESVEVWDVLSNQKVASFNHTVRISGAQWNANFSQILFWSYDDGSIRILDVNSGQVVFLAETHLNSDLVSAALSPDGKSVLSVLTQMPGSVQVWDVASGALKQAFDYPGMVYRAGWNSDGTRILVEGDKVIQLVDPATRAVILEKRDAPHLYKADWSPDRTRIAVRVEFETSVEVWDTITGSIISTVTHTHAEQSDYGIIEVLWSKDNQRLLTHSPGEITLWDSTNGAQLRDITIEARAFNMSWLSWSPDEQKIVYMRSDSSMSVVSLDTQEVVELELPTPIPLSMPDPHFTWNADGSQVMLWRVDNAARVWDTASGKLLATLTHPVPDGFGAELVTGAMWSPDQQHILTLAGPDYCGLVDICPNEVSVWGAP